MTESWGPTGWGETDADETKQYPEVVLGPSVIPSVLRRWAIPELTVPENRLMSSHAQYMLSTREQAAKRREAFAQLEELSPKLAPILKEWEKSRAAINAAEQVLARLEASENVKDIPGIVESRVRVEVLKRAGASLDAERGYLQGSIKRLEEIVNDDLFSWAKFGAEGIRQLISKLETALAEREAVLAWKSDELRGKIRKGAPTQEQAAWDLEPAPARAKKRPGNKTNGEALPEGVSASETD